MSYQNFIHIINIISLLLSTISLSFILFARLKWKEKIYNYLLMVVTGLLLYYLSSILNDSVLPQKERSLQMLPLLFVTVGHFLFLLGSYVVSSFLTGKSSGKPLIPGVLFLWYCGAYFLPTHYNGLIALAPGILYAIYPLVYNLFQRTKNRSGESKWHKITAFITVLFLPFIGYDLFRFFTICTTLPAVTLYCGILSLLLIKLTWEHWLWLEKKQESTSLAEKLHQFPLTPREMEIVKALLHGDSYNGIAEATFISVKTVETHCRNIYRKIGVSNRVELFAKIYKK